MGDWRGAPEMISSDTMSSSRTEVLAASRQNAMLAAASTAGVVAVGVLLSPFAALALAAPAGWLTYRWWQHRSKNGIRF